MGQGRTHATTHREDKERMATMAKGQPQSPKGPKTGPKTTR